MVDRRHRSSMSGIKAQTVQTWGVNKASERYGSLKYRDGAPAPKSTSQPQDRADKHGPNYANEVAKDWRRGFGKGGAESAEGKPGFDRSKKR
jgi:hypothetical protein